MANIGADTPLAAILKLRSLDVKTGFLDSFLGKKLPEFNSLSHGFFMKKSSTVSITALEKQCAALEASIITAKKKMQSQLEKHVAKQQTRIKQLKAQQAQLSPHTTAKENSNKTSTNPKKRSASKHSTLKRSDLKALLTSERDKLKTLKAELKAAKAEVQQALFLQKAKVAAAKSIGKSTRKKRVLGPKNKAITIPSYTAIPPLYLGINTQYAVN